MRTHTHIPLLTIFRILCNVITKNKGKLSSTKKTSPSLKSAYFETFFFFFYFPGINGFNELQNFDKVFMEFESDLFTEESIQVNRSVQTQEVNDKLNAVIKRFLLCVSPYCLLKPAQKTLEWLLQR